MKEEITKEFPEGKENYCPKCYFQNEGRVILRKDCPHNNPPCLNCWHHHMNKAEHDCPCHSAPSKDTQFSEIVDSIHHIADGRTCLTKDGSLCPCQKKQLLSALTKVRADVIKETMEKCMKAIPKKMETAPYIYAGLIIDNANMQAGMLMGFNLAIEQMKSNIGEYENSMHRM